LGRMAEKNYDEYFQTTSYTNVRRILGDVVHHANFRDGPHVCSTTPPEAQQTAAQLAVEVVAGEDTAAARLIQSSSSSLPSRNSVVVDQSSRRYSGIC
jgi:hypothetical protein